jgi:hypothetical protein
LKVIAELEVNLKASGSIGQTFRKSELNIYQIREPYNKFTWIVVQRRVTDT